MHVNKVAPAKLAIVTMGRNAALLDTWPRLVGYALSLRWRHELDVQNLRKLRLRKPSTEKELAALEPRGVRAQSVRTERAHRACALCRQARTPDIV